MDKNRGQRCVDIEIAAYLSIDMGPVSLLLDLCIAHDRWGSSSNPSLNGHLYYPTDIDRTLNETATDKFLQYRADYNHRPSHVISLRLILLVRLDVYTVNLCVFYLYRFIGKLTAFLQFQEFSWRKPTSTSDVWCSPHNSSLGSATSSPIL